MKRKTSSFSGDIWDLFRLNMYLLAFITKLTLSLNTAPSFSIPSIFDDTKFVLSAKMIRLALCYFIFFCTIIMLFSRLGYSLIPEKRRLFTLPLKFLAPLLLTIFDIYPSCEPCLDFSSTLSQCNLGSRPGIVHLRFHLKHQLRC